MPNPTTQAKIDALYSIYSSEYAMDNFSVEQMDALEYAMAVMDLDDEYKGIMNRATRHADDSRKLLLVSMGVFLSSVFLSSVLFAVFAN